VLNFYISNKATPRNTQEQGTLLAKLVSNQIDYNILNIFVKGCNFKLTNATTSKTTAVSAVEKLNNTYIKKNN
jgi:hypothetical protein